MVKQRLVDAGAGSELRPSQFGFRLVAALKMQSTWRGGEWSLLSLSAEDGSMACEENLVPHKLRQHPNLNSKDVQWHPHQATQLATGASSGTVLLWNLEARVNDKLSRTLTGHSRAVNCVCYVPQEASRLLSGSQDCTVKQWDTRVRFAQQHSYRTAAEVRNVAASRLSPLSGG